MMDVVPYRERRSSVPGVVLWQRGAEPSAHDGRILPDGCIDVIWDGARLFVAGPDTRVRWHRSDPSASYVGLRFSRGIGPGFVGVAADEVRDLTPDVSCLWSSAESRVLSEQVAAGPEAALERWLAGRAARQEPPELGDAIFQLAASGVTVAGMADHLGYSVRQLHRRTLPLFGYGPQHLIRVLRFVRALVMARSGLSLAQVAAAAGFADQAHLSRDVRDLAGTTPARLLGDSGG
jgi:AraC-like DNA-binding protein